MKLWDLSRYSKKKLVLTERLIDCTIWFTVIPQKQETRMFVLYLFYIKLYYEVCQHAIDSFKLIAKIHVLASETFKTKLYWQGSKKKLRVKKHRFAWGDDYSYSVVSYKSWKTKFRLVQMIFRFAETKFCFVEAKLCSNDTKFRPKGTKFRNEISPHGAKFRFD